MERWFFIVDGRKSGPVTTERLIVHLETHDPSQVYVWRDGFESWKLASEVSELTLPPPPPSPPPLGEAPPPKPPNHANESRKRKWSKIGAATGVVVTSLTLFANPEVLTKTTAYILGYVGGGVAFVAAIGFIAGAIADLVRGPRKGVVERPQSTTSNQRNVLARHWRGELPLWVSYWIVGLLGNVAFALIAVLVTVSLKAESGYNPFSIFAALATTWLCAVLIGIWQFVGVWRSAKTYTKARLEAGRNALWGGLAQVSVIIGVMGSIAIIAKDGVPQLLETSRMAFQNDPGIPDYAIRVMQNGTEAEIVGGFKYGLARDFTKILDASRQIKVVHLDSLGGRLGEGEKMFKLIRNRGLSTYVSSKCLSACTLAFAGGRERYLRRGAALGFHRGAFPGLTEADLDAVQRDVFRLAGFDERFISAALSTRHKDMWKPPPSALLKAKVITRIVDGSKFAFSGLGANFTKKKLGEHFAAAVPMYGAMKARFPAQYETIMGQMFDSVLKGQTESETIAVLRARLLPFIRTLLPLADDEVLVDYNRLLLDIYTDLYAANPSYCYQFAAGAGASRNLYSQLSKPLIDRELALNERVVKTANRRAQVDKQLVDTLLGKVRAQMVANGVTNADFALFSAPNVPKASHAQYCIVSMTFIREIGKLSQRETAILMREIFKQAKPQ